ncbi:Cutinase domain-containing protein [Rhizoctonia solani AG-1 IA]|uniref:Cutinase domain-containing protein n=1 Tax=Thanatephorus cucumeris (strain AG1-IA) TaxID=983506 RepID=L8WMD8_THACA|nr:Cutinase domain-containing protein [Rhizoctonia solani AG-1 IA]
MNFPHSCDCWIERSNRTCDPSILLPSPARSRCWNRRERFRNSWHTARRISCARNSWPQATQFLYNTVAEYVKTVRAGASTTAKYLADQSARRRNQKFIPSRYSKVLSGYFPHTKLDHTIKSKFIAILVFGDPLRSQRTASWPINSSSVNLSPRAGSTGAQNVVSVCNSGDMFCSPPGSIGLHLAYPRDGSGGKITACSSLYNFEDTAHSRQSLVVANTEVAKQQQVI